MREITNKQNCSRVDLLSDHLTLINYLINNFMYQCAWPQCPDIYIWSNIILDVSEKVSLPEINIKTWMWGISSWLLQQSAAFAPYLG